MSTDYDFLRRLEPQHPRLAVWVWSNGVYTDESNAAKSNKYDPFSPFKNNDDYFYIGLEEKFDLSIFYIKNGGTKLDRVEWEYYDGDSWNQFIGSYDYDFYETGAERFDRLVNWRQKLLGEEKDRNGNILAGTNTPPDTIIRYWIRCKPVGITPSNPPVIEHMMVRSYAEYATARDVARILQLKEDFSYNTTPTKDVVEDFIHNAESKIDYITQKSWRPNIVHDEFHEFSRSGFQLVKNYPTSVIKLEIWDGIKWEEKIQGRNKEYFLVPELGMVYFSRFFILPARIQSYGAALWGWGHGEFSHPVKIRYLYGNNIYYNEREGGLVSDITRKLAAIDILQNYDYTLLIPSGTNAMNMERKSDLWRAEVEENLEALRSWKLF